MTDETEPAPEAQNSQLVDASGRFETKRDMVLLEEAVTEARSMGLSAFTDGYLLFLAFGVCWLPT